VQGAPVYGHTFDAWERPNLPDSHGSLCASVPAASSSRAGTRPPVRTGELAAYELDELEQVTYRQFAATSSRTAVCPSFARTTIPKRIGPRRTTRSYFGCARLPGSRVASVIPRKIILLTIVRFFSQVWLSVGVALRRFTVPATTGHAGSAVTGASCR
jgi:hypothetical protein